MWDQFYIYSNLVKSFMRSVFLIVVVGLILSGCGTTLIRPEFKVDVTDDSRMGRDYLKTPSIRKLEQKVWRLSVGNDSKREHLIFSELEGKLDRNQVMAAYDQLDKPTPQLIEEYLGTIPDVATACTLALSADNDWVGTWQFVKGECSNGKVHGIAHIQSIAKEDPSKVRDYYGRFINGDLIWAIMHIPSSNSLYIGDFKGAEFHGQGVWQSGSDRYVSGWNQGELHGWAIKFSQDEKTQKYFLNYIAQIKQGMFEGFAIQTARYSAFVVGAYDRHTPQEINAGYFKNDFAHGLYASSSFSDQGNLWIWSGTYLDGFKNGIGKNALYARKILSGQQYFYPNWVTYGGYKAGNLHGRHDVVNQEDTFSEERWGVEYNNGEEIRDWKTKNSSFDSLLSKAVSVGIGAVAFNNMGLSPEKALEFQTAFAMDVFNDTGGELTKSAIGKIQAEAEAMKYASTNTGNIAEGASSNSSSAEVEFPGTGTSKIPAEFHGKYLYSTGQWHTRYCLSAGGTGLYWVQSLEDWREPHADYKFQPIDRQKISKWEVLVEDGKIWKDNDGAMKLLINTEDSQIRPEGEGQFDSPWYQKAGLQVAKLWKKDGAPQINHAKRVGTGCW